MSSTLCTICMRGGSQGIKNKNLRLINGKPLMYYTIKQAIKSKIFDKIVFSTDSKKIFKYAKACGAESWFLRPKRLANNKSSKVAAIRHALIETEKYYGKKFNFIMDLDVTSPLRNVSDIVNAHKTFLKKKADFLISGTNSKYNPYFNVFEIVNKKVKKVKILRKKIIRRQEAPITYNANASIYMWKRENLVQSVIEPYTAFPRWNVIFYIMPENRSIDIDSKFDFELVEFLLKKRKGW